MERPNATERRFPIRRRRPRRAELQERIHIALILGATWAAIAYPVGGCIAHTKLWGYYGHSEYGWTKACFGPFLLLWRSAAECVRDPARGAIFVEVATLACVLAVALLHARALVLRRGVGAAAASVLLYWICAASVR